MQYHPGAKYQSTGIRKITRQTVTLRTLCNFRVSM